MEKRSGRNRQKGAYGENSDGAMMMACGGQRIEDVEEFTGRSGTSGIA